MKIVKFSDGKFGIRKWTPFGYLYMDLVSRGFWWSHRSGFFGDCRNSEERVKELFAQRNDKGQPV